MPKRPSEDYEPSYADTPTPDTPLEMLLLIMRQRFEQGDMEGAAALARAAAPYLHPRVPAAAPAAELHNMTDADLDAVRPPD